MHLGRARIGRLQARASARLRGSHDTPGAGQRSEQLMATSEQIGKVGRQVGRSLPRLEARDKVTGRAEYVHTMRLPGMLHGKILRSTIPHGLIKKIDIDAAREAPGVTRVVTAEDVRRVIAEPYYGPAFHDQPVLAIDKVRLLRIVPTDGHWQLLTP